MGVFYDHISEDKIEWIRKQEIFYVATAPLTGDGHVNVSPKGLRDTFFVEGPNEVWYEDLTGSGCETIAHLREPGNGRITICFAGFEGAPQIVRLYGKGTVHEFGTPEYDAKIPASRRKPGSRSLIVIKIHKVGGSCGWGVPYMKFEGHRRSLLAFNQTAELHDNKAVANTPGPSSIEDGPAKGIRRMMWMRYNQLSIDKLPALSTCLTVLPPFENTMPDPVEAAMRVRVPGQKSSEMAQLSLPVTTQTQKPSSNDNYKLFLGVVIGIMIPFLFEDLSKVVRRAISV